MQGQAGVYATAAQLLLRGYVPCFPSVDYGFDLALENGLKIQVKSARLRMSHPSYPEGHYRLEVREGFKLNAKRGVMNHLVRREPRNWKGVADFFVFWCIDENRFFIVPREDFHFKVCFVMPKHIVGRAVPLDQIMRLRGAGLTYKQIAEQLGVHKETIYRRVKHPEKYGTGDAVAHLLKFEDRWDLFDVNAATEELIESAVEVKG